MNFRGLATAVKTAIKNNAADIFVGGGITLMIASVGTAISGTNKARDILEQERIKTVHLDEDGNYTWDEPTLKEKIKLTWKCYIPTAATGVAGTVAIIKGTSDNKKAIKALKSAYNAAKTTIEDHKEEIVAALGEEKAQEVEEKVAAKQASRTVAPESEGYFDVTGVEEPRNLIYDKYANTYFYASKSELEEVETWLNNEFRLDSNYVKLNDMYSHMNRNRYGHDVISTPEIGNVVGWSLAQFYEQNQKIKFKLYGSDKLTPRGQAYLILDYPMPETYELRRTMF